MYVGVSVHVLCNFDTFSMQICYSPHAGVDFGQGSAMYVSGESKQSLTLHVQNADYYRLVITCFTHILFHKENEFDIAKCQYSPGRAGGGGGGGSQ